MYRFGKRPVSLKISLQLALQQRRPAQAILQMNAGREFALALRQLDAADQPKSHLVLARLYRLRKSFPGRDKCQPQPPLIGGVVA